MTKATKPKRGDLTKIHIRLKKAEMVRSPAESFALDIVRQVDLDPNLCFERGPTKDVTRIFEKAEGRSNGKVDAVRDVARGQIFFNTPEDFLIIRGLFSQFDSKPSDFVRAWAKKDIQILEFEDNYAKPKPHGFMGAKIVIKVGKGIDETYELQFAHKDMRLTNQVSHAIYIEIRKIKDRALAEASKIAAKRGHYLEIPTNLDKREELVQSLLSSEQNAIIAGYEAAIRQLYEADTKNYRLDRLKASAKPSKKSRPQRGMNGTGEHLQLND